MSVELLSRKLGYYDINVGFPPYRVRAIDFFSFICTKEYIGAENDAVR